MAHADAQCTTICFICPHTVTQIPSQHIPEAYKVAQEFAAADLRENPDAAAVWRPVMVHTRSFSHTDAEQVPYRAVPLLYKSLAELSWGKPSDLLQRVEWPQICISVRPF